MPYYTKDPKRDHNFDNHPYTIPYTILATFELSQRLHSVKKIISDLFLNPGFDSESDSDLQSDLEFDYFLTLKVIFFSLNIF